MTFDIHTPDTWEDEPDWDALRPWIDGLLSRFEQSPEGQAGIDAGMASPFLDMVVDLGLTYCGVGPARMSRHDLAEILLDLFPRKVIMEPAEAAPLVASLTALGAWLDREFGVSRSAEWAPVLTSEVTDELRSKLADPGSFGLAKGFFAAGDAAGFDMSDEQQLNAFALLHNAALAARGELQRADAGAAKKKKAQRKAQKKARRQSRKKR